MGHPSGNNGGYGANLNEAESSHEKNEVFLDRCIGTLHMQTVNGSTARTLHLSWRVRGLSKVTQPLSLSSLLLA